MSALARGFASFNSGRYEEALTFFREAALRSGERETAQRLVAHCLQALGRTEQALRELSSLLRRRPADIEARLAQARLLKLQGRIEEAQRSYERALRLDRRRSEIHIELVELARARARRESSKGKLNEAESVLRRARLLIRGNAGLDGDLEELLSRRAAASPRAAEGLLTRGLAVLPGSRRLREELAAAKLSRARRLGGAAAESLYRAALAADPHSAEAKAGLIEAYRARASSARSAGRLETARSWLEKGAALDTGRLDVRRELAGVIEALAVAAESRGEACAELWRAHARLRAGDASSRSDRFRALMGKGLLEEAFAEGERILDEGASVFDLRAFLNPWDIRALEAVKPEHRRRADEYVRAHPRSPWGYYYRGFLAGREGLDDLRRLDSFPFKRYGWMLYRAGQQFLCQQLYKEAIVYLRRALACRVVDWRAHSFLAEAYLCLRRVPEALDALDKARETAPRSELGHAMAWRGAFMLWLGRYGEALDILEWACRLGGEHSECWRAAALIQLGRVNEALPVIERAIALDPDDREALVWRGEAKRLLGRHREAVKDLSREPAGLWALMNRGLARAELGDVAGLKKDVSGLSREVIGHIERRARLAPLNGGARSMRALLTAGLRLAKGFRRDDYAYAIWMA
jgi:tetratricopeptide (TPR) repeat protein